MLYNLAQKKDEQIDIQHIKIMYYTSSKKAVTTQQIENNKKNRKINI
jgi:hypothetical protein